MKALKFLAYGIKDNAQHIAGMAVGALLLKKTGFRFSKEQRGQFFFSTVSANLTADGVKLPFLLFALLPKRAAKA